MLNPAPRARLPPSLPSLSLSNPRERQEPPRWCAKCAEFRDTVAGVVGAVLTAAGLTTPTPFSSTSLLSLLSPLTSLSSFSTLSPLSASSSEGKPHERVVGGRVVGGRVRVVWLSA